jgi:peptidoglycan/LPS O-acetylase OafA/YrhL
MSIVYSRQIDGLRALAVMPVIFFHAGLPGFQGGFVGVDIFFVISGYLITSIILADLHNNDFTFYKFYMRRMRRILPALFFVLLITLPFALFLLPPKELKDYSQALVSIIFFLSNIYFLQKSGYFDTENELKPLIHTWSLSVEEQFYVITPIMLFVFWRFSRRSIPAMLGCLIVLSLIFSCWLTYKYPASAFYILPSRAWELFIGSAIAAIPQQIQHDVKSKWFSAAISAAGLFSIIFSISFIGKSQHFPGLLALLPTLGTAAIILFAAPNSIIGRLLGSFPFVTIGLISYSAYLWHQPILAFARLYLFDDPKPYQVCVLIFLSLVLAKFSQRYVELPFRHPNRIPPKVVIALAFSIGLLLFLLGLIGHWTTGLSGRFDEGKTPQRQYGVLHDGRGACYDRQVKDACRFLAKTSETQNLIWIGDSLLDSVTSIAVPKLMELGFGSEVVTSPGCFFLPGVEMVNLKELSDNDCNRRQAAIEDLLANRPPSIIVIGGRLASYLSGVPFDNQVGGVETPENGSAFMRARGSNFSAVTPVARETVMKSLIEGLNAQVRSGHQIMLIYPLPEMGWDVARQAFKIKQFGYAGRELSIPYDVFVERAKFARSVYDSVGSGYDTIRVDMADEFCPATVPRRCIAELANRLLFTDHVHLSKVGAEIVTDRMARKLVVGLTQK